MPKQDSNRWSNPGQKRLNDGMGKNTLLGDIGNRMDIADSEEEMRRIKRGLSGTFSKDQSQDA